MQGGVADGRRLQRVQAELTDSLRLHARGQRARQQHRPLVLAHHTAYGDLLADVVQREQEQPRLSEVAVIALIASECAAQSFKVAARVLEGFAIERAEGIKHLRPQHQPGSRLVVVICVCGITVWAWRLSMSSGGGFEMSSIRM